VRAHKSGERAAEHGPGEGEDKAGDEQSPKGEQEELPELDTPHLRLLELLQETEGAELDGLQLAEVEEVDQDGNRSGGEAEEEEGVEKCHTAREPAPW